MGVAANGLLAIIGDKPRFKEAHAEFGPMTSSQLTQKTNAAERYIREWLSAQATSDYIQYNEDNDNLLMSPKLKKPLILVKLFYGEMYVKNFSFKVAKAKDFPVSDYDVLLFLIACMIWVIL